MHTLPLEVNLDGIIYYFAAIMIVPALLLAIIGFILSKNKSPKAAKVFYILAGIYLLISFGTCGVLLSS